MTDQGEPYGLVFGRSVAAGELEEGTIVALDGRVVERAADPDGAERVRLVVVPVLGPPPGRNPDQREIVISAPRDMLFGTAQPQNIELAPLRPRR